MTGKKPEWPDGHKFAICLTHDVDRVDKHWWHCVYYFLKKRNMYQVKSIFNKKKEMPYWNFERIMDIEKEYGVRSTFFFLNETKKIEILKPSQFPMTFGYYKILDPRIEKIIKTLDSGGWEIGVHGSYDSHVNQDLMMKEKLTLEKIIGKPILGIRQHYLRSDFPRTWELQQAAGFGYDSSFGFSDRIGSRNGKNFPFYPIGGDFLEIPLTIMDGPLLNSSKNIEEVWHNFEKIIDQIEKEGGLITLLWHSNRFNENEFQGYEKMYEMILKECKKRGAWIATGKEIAAWWKGN